VAGIYENTTFKVETSCKARGEIFIDWRLRFYKVQEDWLMVNAEPDTDVGIPTRIIEDEYNSSNNSRGVSRQQQVCDITYAKMQILWL
jgi:hypothetical protein